MRGWIASRLLQTVLVVFLSLTAVFGMVRLSGDPVLLFMPMDIQAKDVNEYRERLGFNDPLLVQYARFMRGAVRGDGAVDHAGTVLMVLGQAMPGFWLGLILIYLFAVQLRWLPTGGMGGLAHLVMPAVVLAAFYAARVARLTRSAVLEALGEDYVLTARAKGLAERHVVGKHALRNSAIPIVTLAGLEAGQLLGGAVVTETIFAWPGLGRLTVQALLNRDFPVVMAAVSFTSIVYTLMNLVVDLLYAWLDPRVRLRS